MPGRSRESRVRGDLVMVMGEAVAEPSGGSDSDSRRGECSASESAEETESATESGAEDDIRKDE